MQAQLNAHPHLVVGLMSGTSADGIDAVVARISDQDGQLKAQVLAHIHRPFTAALRKQILEVGLHGHVAEICQLNFLLGERFAEAALAVIRRAGVPPRRVAAIGSHGQTIHHLPNVKTPSTLQIGEPSVIAERTGITTIADFRVRDMAAGGQGAPLVPFADWALLTHNTHPRIMQNIGGIGNLTFLLPRAALEEVVAFDTGPGNMVIDAVVNVVSGGKQMYDRNGHLAGSGKVSAQLLRKLMQHPFLKRRPPKTTGREEFGEPFVQDTLRLARQLRVSDTDLLTTVTAFTAESIADAYRRFIFRKLSPALQGRLQVIVGGGGAKNATLRRMLKERLPQAELLVHDDLGIKTAAKEALAFGILAYQTLGGRPGNVPSATGARRPVVLGKIVPGVTLCRSPLWFASH